MPCTLLEWSYKIWSTRYSSSWKSLKTMGRFEHRKKMAALARERRQTWEQLSFLGKLWQFVTSGIWGKVIE